jgi:hypothetical protein
MFVFGILKIPSGCIALTCAHLAMGLTPGGKKYSYHTPNIMRRRQKMEN